MSLGKVQEQQKTQTPVPLKTKKDIKYQRDKDREMVRGIFRYYEVPGGSVSFVFRAYDEDPVEKYEMYDGQIYTIPLGVAKHLNKNCWYPVHAYAQDETGGASVKIGQKVNRMGFQSLEFVDTDDLSTMPESIITVEKM